MKRYWILGAIVGAGLIAINVASQQPPPSLTTPPGPAAGARAGGPGFPPITAIEKLADNLYRIPGGGGNSAVFVRGDGVLLVDTKVPNNGQALLDLIRTVTDRPVTHIINTHVHGDHTGSNVFFPATVEIVAQAATAESMKKNDLFKSAESQVGLPDRAFTDRLSLFKGDEQVDLYHFGAAHTGGDALVVFRNARVMHAGDMFSSKAQPLVDASNGGSGVAYGETIGKAARAIRNVERVITGHSDVFPWQDFVDYGEFNRLLVAHARASLAAGKSAEQAMIELKLPENFSGYTLTGGRGGRAGNFTALYAELAAAK